MKKHENTCGTPAFRRFRVWLLVVLAAGAPWPVFGQETVLEPVAKHETAKHETAEQKVKRLAKEGWKPLLPKKGLEGWKPTDFFSPGEVTRNEDELILEMGNPLTGITYSKKDFPKDNFEISVQAKRIEGGDFLCGLTFPIGEEYCSLIAGGWGGGVVGLSSLNGADASENESSTYFEFENGKWYEFRLRVDQDQVRVWIDGEEFFRIDREYQEFSTRIEVDVSKPLGYCVYQSKVAIRDFRYRALDMANPDVGKAEKP